MECRLLCMHIEDNASYYVLIYTPQGSDASTSESEHDDNDNSDDEDEGDRRRMRAKQQDDDFDNRKKRKTPQGKQMIALKATEVRMCYV